jgi:hypothetical protein
MVTMGFRGGATASDWGQLTPVTLAQSLLGTAQYKKNDQVKTEFDPSLVKKMTP